jgi:dihydrofolate reductase/thymidylate synthase
MAVLVVSKAWEPRELDELQELLKCEAFAGLKIIDNVPQDATYDLLYIITVIPYPALSAYRQYSFKYKNIHIAMVINKPPMIRSAHYEIDYLDIMYRLIVSGQTVESRAGPTRSLFGINMNIDLKCGFPLMTSKKVFYRGIEEELRFFLNGQTDSKILSDKGVHIWDFNTTKEVLAKLKLPYEEGTMGPMYGFLWRHFGATYEGPNADYTGKGFDQIANVLKLLLNDPFSRRIQLTSYDPSVAHLGVLNPCHTIGAQFYAQKNTETEYYLNYFMYQRSADWCCGVPFNIASSSLLVFLICETLNRMQSAIKWLPGTFSYSICDAHIYENHVDNAILQMLRMPLIKERPSINIDMTTSDDPVETLLSFKCKLENYTSCSPVQYTMNP